MTEASNGDTDEALIVRAMDGDEAAWDELCRRHWSRLRTAVLDRMSPLLRRRVGASDVVQDALLELIRKPPRFQPSEGRGAGWLDAVVDNMVRRAIEWHWETDQRSARRENHDSNALRHLAADRRATTPGRGVATREEAERVERAIAQLPEQDQVVVRLRHWEGLRFREIALLLGKNPDAVGVQYRRALTKLEKLLDERSAGPR